MENYIDLINAYLDQSLSESEVLAFENRLKTDTEFNTIYKEHLIVIKGIERTKTKLEINDAKANFIRGKRFKQVGIIIGILIFASLIWFLVSKNSAKNELEEILNFETEMIQSFDVSTDSIISIEGKKGTLIKFNPKDLEYQSKKPLKANNLSIILLELTNQQDLLLANAQTISNGKILISGGAFKIDIKVGDESLVLKKGKTISVKFPKNTNEDEMQIFYGKRNENGYLNWNLSEVQLKNEKHFTILCRDSIVLDEEITRAFGGVETMRQILKIDTLGFLSKNEIRLRFPKKLGFNKQKDTLVLLMEYIDSGSDAFDTNYEIIDTNQLKEIIEIYDERNRRGSNSSKSTSRINENYKSFYEAINISKLGWINIDKFSNEEDKITINLKNNLDFNLNTHTEEAYPEDSVWHQTYLIDNDNNTILNVYSSILEIPKGRKFTIISCCIVDDTFYLSRQVIKSNKADTFIIDYKKRNKSQIKSLLRLDTNSTEEEKPKQKRVTTANKEVEAIIIEKEVVDRKVSNKNNTISFFKSNNKEPQVIKVNTEEDFKITLREGTKISIPKNAFVNDKTGKEVSGEIDIQITEFYKLSDMLLVDLSTKSDDKLLETGGMLYVEAKKNNSKLRLSPEKKINIVFNTSGKLNMQLFTGEKNNDGINWKLDKQTKGIEAKPAQEQVDYLIMSNEPNSFTFQSVEEVPIYPGCENSSNAERKECMKEAINKFISRKFNTSIADDLTLTGKQTIRTSFEVDEEGNIGKIEARASHKEMAEEAIRVIELFPKLIPAKQKGKSVAISYYLPIVFKLEGETLDQPSITIKSDKAFIKTFGEKAISEIGNSDIERYTLATSNLGWINCDRFVNSKKKKIKYKVKIKDADGANVKMIFKSISSVLPSERINDNYSFGDVPIDEDIILLAIKKNGDKIFLGVKELKTKVISEIDLNFKEVTVNELKAELYKLNKGFN
ncbi:energy transducer TonB [uncultured Winogradskyella sp.]|uniref:energy transducer TonB n=1 Tax=uncultured Winogradskyella sp. TaxID=395353 RepID=UPI0026068418|nr:energy transducer TonB [uncultured Winogradskyella sp.]